jgi:hypothetical protein
VRRPLARRAAREAKLALAPCPPPPRKRVAALGRFAQSFVRAPPSICASPIEHRPVAGIGKRPNQSPPVFLSNRAGASMRLAFKQIDEAAAKDGIRIAAEIDGDKIQHAAGQWAALDPPDA